MMSDSMRPMQAARPCVDMAMQEQEEWIAERQKRMDEMMGQMIR